MVKENNVVEKQSVSRKMVNPCYLPVFVLGKVITWEITMLLVLVRFCMRVLEAFVFWVSEVYENNYKNRVETMEQSIESSVEKFQKKSGETIDIAKGRVSSFREKTMEMIESASAKVKDAEWANIAKPQIERIKGSHFLKKFSKDFVGQKSE